MILFKITPKIGYYLLCLTLVFGSCSNRPQINELDISRDNGLPKSSILILEEPIPDSIDEIFERLAADEPDTFFTDWKYDSISNSLKIGSTKNKKAALALYNHKLWLGFDNHIAKENNNNYISTSPFSKMENKGIFSSLFIVNDKPYSGLLIGIHKGSNKKILEIYFYEGQRIGKFNVWTDLGNRYSKAMSQEQLFEISPSNVRKPIVYFYPTQEQKITFKVNFKGKITHSYPKYNPKKGWTVSAKPNGQITDLTTHKTYPYLFWEGQSSYIYNMNSGFVIKGENTADFLDQALADLGLNRKETTDFITYWLPELEQNKYNHIHFSTIEYSQNAPLEISPKPQTLIRVFMVYKPLSAPINIPSQSLKKVERKGFTVVEWGGKKANSFFTNT